MTQILCIALGGAIGASLRFLIGFMVTAMFGKRDVLTGTVLSNLSGCFFAGFTLGFIQLYAGISDELILFLTVGILGSLTTFSTFALEVYQLIHKKKFTDLLSYFVFQIIIAFTVVVLGYKIATWIFPGGAL